MKDKILSAITDAELNEIGRDISLRDFPREDRNTYYDLIEERRRQLNDVMAEISEMTLSDVVGDEDYE